MKYRKKLVTIEAFQYNGDLKNRDGKYYVPSWAIKAFKKGIMYYDSTDNSPSELFVSTMEGVLIANVGDYVIQGTKGELYPCKAEIFKEIYDEFLTGK